MIDGLCYGLLLVAWVIDLLTPQLFVAAILLNGPIALSSLALRPRLTLQLTILAELANVVAGYVNGVQAGYHWDAIAVGDRLLSAASFLLVGALTARSQESARRAGEAEERERQVARERGLRHAMEHVRASLNMETVLRSAAQEAQILSGCDRAMLVVRQSSFDAADCHETQAGDDVRIIRRPLLPEESSLVERARDTRRPVLVSTDEPLGRLLGYNALIAIVEDEPAETALILSWKDHVPSLEASFVQSFTANLAVALGQARMFIRLAEQNEQIVQQRNALSARSEIIRDLVYALAHDLRTPLVAADVTMEQAISGSYGELPDAYRKVLSTSIAANQDLRRLVETLLFVARYESGEDSQVFKRFRLVDVLKRVVEEMLPVARRRGVALDLDALSEPEIVADEDEIRRAAINLVANALEATPQGGRVLLAVRRNGGVTIDVIDDGFGVPVDRRLRLFERFGGVRGGGGTGLGLYIVRRIAEKYGGRAQYEPREPRGSRFSIVLPKEIVA